MASRHAHWRITLCIAMAGIVTINPAFAQTGDYSRPFLDAVNEACWNGPLEPPRRDPLVRRALVRVYLANQTADDLNQVCVYDLICGEVVFSGRIRRGDRQTVTICPNSRRRGGILILDPFGRVTEYTGLASPATIQLQPAGHR